MTGDSARVGDIPPPPRPIEHRDADASGWWLSIILGFGLMAVGAWLLTNLYDSVTVLAVLVGVSLIAGGIVDATMARSGSERAGWLAGGLLVVAGVAVLVWPDITLWALAVIAGAALVISGVVHAVMALADRDGPDGSAHLALGILGVVLGVVVIAWPGATLLVLAILLGVRALVTGVIAVVTGWQLHRLAT